MGCAERRRDWGHVGARLRVWNETDREERKRASDAEMCSKPMSRRNQNTTRRPARVLMDGMGVFDGPYCSRSSDQARRRGLFGVAVLLCRCRPVEAMGGLGAPSANLAAPGILVR